MEVRKVIQDCDNRLGEAAVLLGCSLTSCLFQLLCLPSLTAEEMGFLLCGDGLAGREPRSSLLGAIRSRLGVGAAGRLPQMPVEALTVPCLRTHLAAPSLLCSPLIPLPDLKSQTFISFLHF